MGYIQKVLFIFRIIRLCLFTIDLLITNVIGPTSYQTHSAGARMDRCDLDVRVKHMNHIIKKHDIM